MTNIESRTARHAAHSSRPIGSTSPVRTAVYRAEIAAQSDADRWMNEMPRAQWSETLMPGAIGVDAHLLAQLGATEADADETATAYAETFRATVRAALSAWEVGDRVEGGADGTDDHDTGEVTEVTAPGCRADDDFGGDLSDQQRARVAWSGGVSTWHDADELRPAADR